jgi:hypothetical protein
MAFVLSDAIEPHICRISYELSALWLLLFVISTDAVVC